MMTEKTPSDRRVEGRDGVSLYLEEIARTPLLTAEEEVELSKTIEAGLFAEHLLEERRIGHQNGGAPLFANEEELEWLAEEGRKAVDRFTTSNLRLVVSIARRYARSQLPMLDLIQEGNTGLIRAVEKFDYTKGYKFSTYATWWIRQAVTRGIAQQARVVRLPVHTIEDINSLTKAEYGLTRILGREPEPEELAFELDVDIERVMDLLNWRREHISLDTPIGDDSEASLGDVIAQETTPGPEDSVMNASVLEQLNKYLSYLEDRLQGIIRLRYGLVNGRVHKLAEVGAIYGLSPERVRQLELEAMQKLRNIALVIESGGIPQRPTVSARKSRSIGVREQKRQVDREVLEEFGVGLDSKHRQILEAYLATKSMREASKTLGMTQGSFSTRLRLARLALARLANQSA